MLSTPFPPSQLIHIPLSAKNIIFLLTSTLRHSSSPRGPKAQRQARSKSTDRQHNALDFIIALNWKNDRFENKTQLLGLTLIGKAYKILTIYFNTRTCHHQVISCRSESSNISLVVLDLNWKGLLIPSTLNYVNTCIYPYNWNLPTRPRSNCN